VMLRKEHAIDTGGPGTYRGGAANLKDTLWFTSAEQYLSPFRTKEPSGVGANGGRPGPNGAMWLFPPTDDGVRPIGTADDVYRNSRPVAGLLDPDTKALDPENGVYHYFAAESVWRTAPNTVLRCITNGGGGWGDPMLRDLGAVLRDVRNEYVSIEAAERDYGVVVAGDPHFDPEGLSIDRAATERLRAAARDAHRVKREEVHE
jgi:N-methylhydantoinase B